MVTTDEISLALHQMHTEARAHDLLRQLGVLARLFGDRVSPSNHTRRRSSPRVGRYTQFARQRMLAGFIRALRASEYRLEYLDQLQARHVRAVAQAWDAQHLATRTIQTRLAAVRMLMAWVGRMDHMPHNRELLPPSRWRVLTAAMRDKTWVGNGINVFQVVESINPKDRWIRYVLLLQRRFGLRTKEAALLHPHQGDGGTVLRVQWGSKGGRYREVPIENNAQRALLDEVKTFCAPDEALIGPLAKISWRQARHRYDYVIGHDLQITRAGAGVSPHGLRAEYGCRVYFWCTGELAPIQGGKPVARAVDQAARQLIAERLGHNRTSVTSAYLGGVLRAPSARSNGRQTTCKPPLVAG